MNPSRPPNPPSTPPSSPGAAPSLSEDPNTATLLHILRKLNWAEDEFTDENEKGLEMGEIQVHCEEFWAVKLGKSDPKIIIDMLVDNQMVDRQRRDAYSWVRQRQVAELFRITEPGKAHLLSAEKKQGRVA